MNLSQLEATHDRRLELRASRDSCQREGASTVRENIAGVAGSTPGAIAGAADPVTR
jgi:hypothetical protein